MLNYIWPLFIIIAFLFAIVFGNIPEINTSIFQSTEDAVNLCIRLIGTICLWNGIMKIAEKTSIINSFKRILRPQLKVLFPWL